MNVAQVRARKERAQSLKDAGLTDRQLQFVLLISLRFGVNLDSPAGREDFLVEVDDIVGKLSGAAEQ